MDFVNRGYHSLSGPETIELSEFSRSGISPKQAGLQETSDQSEQYDTAPTTHMLALAGLMASWAFGIACVIVGSGAVTKPTTSKATRNIGSITSPIGPFHNWPEVNVSPLAADLLPLLGSFVITALMVSRFLKGIFPISCCL
jgi:hypothetical protein